MDRTVREGQIHGTDLHVEGWKGTDQLARELSGGETGLDLSASLHGYNQDHHLRAQQRNKDGLVRRGEAEPGGRRVDPWEVLWCWGEAAPGGRRVDPWEVLWCWGEVGPGGRRVDPWEVLWCWGEAPEGRRVDPWEVLWCWGEAGPERPRSLTAQRCCVSE